jgi:hypothetical protein
MRLGVKRPMPGMDGGSAAAQARRLEHGDIRVAHPGERLLKIGDEYAVVPAALAAGARAGAGGMGRCAPRLKRGGGEAGDAEHRALLIDEDRRLAAARSPRQVSHAR